MTTAATASSSGGPRITALRVSAYEFPIERPESDGTLEWDRTVLVLVEARAGDVEGIGWTYGNGLAVKRRDLERWLVFEEGSHAQQAAGRR